MLLPSVAKLEHSEDFDNPSVQLMAILNCTPDSFSDGGRFHGANDIDFSRLLEAAQKAVTDGARILDIGGESTRPGAQAVPVDEELKRVIPVIELLHRHLPDISFSVDTRKSEVARQALAAGANIVNDVSGLQFDPAMAATVANYPKVRFVLMHSQGTPETMQKNPYYPRGVVTEVAEFFEKQCELAMQAGLSRKQIILDPGFGFGKTRVHNQSLLKNLASFKRLGYPLLVGLSRKGFLAPTVPAIERDVVSVAAAFYAVTQGAEIARVHNVLAHQQAMRLGYQLVSEND